MCKTIQVGVDNQSNFIYILSTRQIFLFLGAFDLLPFSTTLTTVVTNFVYKIIKKNRRYQDESYMP